MAHTAQHNIRWEQLYMHSPNVWECITWLACDTRQKENPMRLCTLGIIVYYSDIRTFIHKGYSIIFNLYVQPNRAYKSLWCSWTVNLSSKTEPFANPGTSQGTRFSTAWLIFSNRIRVWNNIYNVCARIKNSYNNILIELSYRQLNNNSASRGLIWPLLV